VIVGGTAPALLGLVSGHYPIPRQPEHVRDSLDSTIGSANAGIAVVVPAQAIIDVAMSDELVRQRGEAKKEIENDIPQPTLDTGLENYRREDFLADMEAARKPATSSPQERWPSQKGES
jgi:hypothetical protein